MYHPWFCRQPHRQVYFLSRAHLCQEPRTFAVWEYGARRDPVMPASLSFIPRSPKRAGSHHNRVESLYPNVNKRLHPQSLPKEQAVLVCFLSPYRNSAFQQEEDVGDSESVCLCFCEFFVFGVWMCACICVCIYRYACVLYVCVYLCVWRGESGEVVPVVTVNIVHLGGWRWSLAAPCHGAVKTTLLWKNPFVLQA